MITILIPIKINNIRYSGLESLYSALKVPDLRCICILDSSPQPITRMPSFCDFLRICDIKNIKVSYEYDTFMSVSQARYYLISKATIGHVMFLDSDILIDQFPSGVSDNLAFIAPRVINVGDVDYYQGESSIWLEQFGDSQSHVYTTIAGTFGLIFHKRFAEGPRWLKFMDHVVDIWPYEDALLSRFLCLSEENKVKTGVISHRYKVFHLGQTRKELWNYTLARKVEQNISDCLTLDSLLDVADFLKVELSKNRFKSN